MNWFESLIYGLISGITEFLPISSSAHQSILLKIFGESAADPLQNLLVHLALIFSLFTGGRSLIEQLRRQQHRVHNYRSGRPASNSLELRFLKNAVFPYFVVFLFLYYGIKIQFTLPWVALFLLLNAIILFLQSRMIQGNKDEHAMSVMDSVLIGVAGALSVFPGISRVGAMLTVFTARGVSRKKAVNWVILLSIPGMILAAFVDILNMFTNAGNIHFPGNVVGYLLSAVGGYAAGYFGIHLMKNLISGKDNTGFAYYSLGGALFSFILYLMVV